MARDRFIYWEKEVVRIGHTLEGPKPTKDEVERVLRNFFSEAATVEWSTDRFMITLPGRWSDSLKGIKGAYPTPDREPGEDERWIEVYLGRDNIDVITRQQDDFTNSLADGLAKVFARFWKGNLDDE